MRRIARHDEVRIPILMYHSISDKEDKRFHPYFQTNTSPEVFRKHMHFLYRNQYKVVGIADAVEFLSNAKNVPNKLVVLTFDDGYRDFYMHAFPILNKYGFLATVFLPTAYIHTSRKMFIGRECLNWQEIKQLQENGVRFGSHTVNHVKLSSLTIKEIKYEIRHSKETIENNIGFSLESFSYPFAFPEENTRFTDLLRVLLYKYGYNCGVTTIIGTNSKKDDNFFLKRIPINSNDDISFFKSKIESGYDWVKIFQYYYKYLKKTISEIRLL